MKVKVRDNQTGQIVEVDDSQLGQFGLTTPSPVAQAPVQSTTPQPTEPQEKSVLQGNLQSENLMSGDSLLAQVLNSVAKPFVKSGQNIGAAVTLAGKRATGAKGNDNPFISNEEIEKRKIDNSGAVMDQAKNSASILSWLIPFGKAGFTGSKAIAPGAAVGAAQSLPDAQNVEDVVTGGLVGGATGGVLQGGSKILNGILNVGGKVSPALEQGAQKLEQGTRKIRVKPSIYGSGQEKAIDETLTRRGVTGTPDEQYAALEPTFNNVEKDIQNVIKANPNVSILRADIKQSFLDSLKSSVRSGELTQKQATLETEKYLNDLVKASGGTGKFTNISLEKLRNLKKLVNEDYKSVYAITSNPMSVKSLTPKQKVIEAAWDSLDNAVKNASPEMKALLKDESNLYKAAPSLSAARSNPPTLRLFGTSIPAPVVERGKSTLTNVLRGAGNKTQGLSNVSVGAKNKVNNPLLQRLVGQAGTRLPQVSSNGQNEPDQTYNANNQQDTQDTTSIAQPQRQITAEQMQKVFLAQSQGLLSSKTADAIKSAYDVQEAAIKNSTGKAKKYSEGDKKFLLAKNEATKALSALEGGQVTSGKLAAVGSNLEQFLGTQKPETTAFKAQLATARTAARNALLGANMSDKELESYLDAIFSYSNEPRIIMQKLRTFVQSMQDYEDSIAGTGTGLDDLLQQQVAQ